MYSYEIGRLYKSGDGLIFVFGQRGNYYKGIKYFNSLKMYDIFFIGPHNLLTNIIDFNKPMDTNFITKIYEYWYRK